MKNNKMNPLVTKSIDSFGYGVGIMLGITASDWLFGTKTYLYVREKKSAAAPQK